MFRLPRFVLFMILPFCQVWNVLPAAQTDASAEFGKAVQPFLLEHCDRCHNADKQKGDFRLDTLSRKVGEENNPQWEEVMERINSGEMPPKKEKKRPSAEESAKVVEWLSARMRDGESAQMAL